MGQDSGSHARKSSQISYDNMFSPPQHHIDTVTLQPVTTFSAQHLTTSHQHFIPAPGRLKILLTPGTVQNA